MGEQIIIPAKPQIPSLDRYLGCILGGALGDAIGYAVEFDNLNVITARFGESGIRSPQLDPVSGKALISDDTQMTLFTIDGILSDASNSIDWDIKPRFAQIVTKSYLKWLYTQTGNKLAKEKSEDWFFTNILNYNLLSVPELFNRRAPGNTCLSALGERSVNENNTLSNHSKGCGGVMRVAPIGLYLHDNYSDAYRYARDAAAVTHRHTTSDQSSGALAAIVALITRGKSVRQAVRQTLSILNNELFKDGETEKALLQAIAFADDKNVSVRDAIKGLGEGWVAEEALAIAVYCALKAKNFSDGVLYSVNHDGDSDSTGAICGNILGALHGHRSLPQSWLENLELRDFMEHLTRIFYKTATIKAIRAAGQIEDKEEFADIFKPNEN